MSRLKAKILGISCFYHDAAAALLVDGRIIAAAEEERFTRKKHDSDFPLNAARFCLEQGGLRIDDIDYVVFYDKPFLKFERIIETYIKTWPRGLVSFVTAMRAWFKKKFWVEYAVAKNLGYQGKVLFTEHHYAHAAAAYYASSFDEGTIVTMDGVGEWETTTIGYGKGNDLRLGQAIHFPHSLGLLYSAVTAYLGFRINDEEYKVMGLAAYGNPERYAEHFRQLMTFSKDGSFALNMDYFSYEYALRMTSGKFDRLFGGLRRREGDPFTQEHKDIAAALQKTLNEAVLGIVRHVKSLYPSARNLCLTGGVALNGVANGRVLTEGLFENIYVFPASGDAGGAVGAACYVYFDVLKNEKKGSVMESAFFGPEFSDQEIGDFLETVDMEEHGIEAELLPEKELFRKTARRIADNRVVGWFQGRMEFGPRALGARSILADARQKENWQRVNLKIKFRESFRPFAPAVLRERAEEYFDLHGKESPYMLLVVPVKDKGIPAVTHVDGTARVQTVTSEINPLFYALIEEFAAISGCPVIINTSFNVSGEPIVCTPKEAFRCFLDTDMDNLAIGNYLLTKTRKKGVGIEGGSVENLGK